MKTRTILIVVAILGVIAFLMFGRGPRPFGRDARTAEVQRNTSEDTYAARPAQAAPEPRNDLEMSPALSMPSQAIQTEAAQAHPRPKIISRQYIEFEADSAKVSVTAIEDLSKLAKRYRDGDVSLIALVHRGELPEVTNSRLEAVKRQLTSDGVPDAGIRVFEGASEPSGAIQVIAVLYNDTNNDRDAVAAAPPPRK